MSILGYRKLGRLGEHLILDLVGHLQSDNVLSGGEVTQGQKLLQRHLGSRGIRNLRHVLGIRYHLFIGPVL